MTRYFILFSMIFGILFADGPKNKFGKKWNKAKHKRHKFHKVVHRPHYLKIKYDYNWYFKPWRYVYSHHKHNDVIVIEEQDVKLDTDQIFEQIEKLLLF